MVPVVLPKKRIINHGMCRLEDALLMSHFFGKILIPAFIVEEEKKEEKMGKCNPSTSASLVLKVTWTNFSARLTFHLQAHFSGQFDTFSPYFPPFADAFTFLTILTQ